MVNTKNWSPRFHVDPAGGVKLLLALVRDGHRTIDEVAPFLMFKPESQDESVSLVKGYCCCKKSGTQHEKTQQCDI